MRKKGHPIIPDFSHTRAGSPSLQPRAPRQAARPPAPARVATAGKPQATSAKSGRRGQ